MTLKEKGFDPYKWPDIDAFIASYYGITDGIFDPMKTDQDGLEGFKNKYTPLHPVFAFYLH